MALIPLEKITGMVASLNDPSSQGTATLIVYKERPFLLTAAHVARAVSISGDIVLKGPGDRPLTTPIRNLCGNVQLSWRTHAEADLAAFEIFPADVATREALIGRFLPLEYFCSDVIAPSRTIPLTSVGFPLGLGASGFFSPLTFETRASSGLVTMLRADTKTPQAFFVLENPSVCGYSGCPVIDVSIYHHNMSVNTGGGTCFYGIMHGTLLDNTGGKMAMVTPSFYVHDLFAAF